MLSACGGLSTRRACWAVYLGTNHAPRGGPIGNAVGNNLDGRRGLPALLRDPGGSGSHLDQTLKESKRASGIRHGSGLVKECGHPRERLLLLSGNYLHNFSNRAGLVAV
jgi:hypothetical protein